MYERINWIELKLRENTTGLSVYIRPSSLNDKTPHQIM